LAIKKGESMEIINGLLVLVLAAWLYTALRMQTRINIEKNRADIWRKSCLMYAKQQNNKGEKIS